MINNENCKVKTVSCQMWNFQIQKRQQICTYTVNRSQLRWNNTFTRILIASSFWTVFFSRWLGIRSVASRRNCPFISYICRLLAWLCVHLTKIQFNQEKIGRRSTAWTASTNLESYRVFTDCCSCVCCQRRQAIYSLWVRRELPSVPYCDRKLKQRHPHQYSCVWSDVTGRELHALLVNGRFINRHVISHVLLKATHKSLDRVLSAPMCEVYVLSIHYATFNNAQKEGSSPSRELYPVT